MSKLAIEVDEENDLVHYGVKGMRWGVRRSRAQLAKGKKEKGHEGENEPKPVGKAAIKTSTKRVNPKDLTDAQLKRRIERLNMEKQYSKLTKPPDGAAKKLAKFVSDSAMKAVKSEADRYIQSQAKGYLGLAKNVGGKKVGVPPPPNRFPSAAPNAADRVG